MSSHAPQVRMASFAQGFREQCFKAISTLRSGIISLLSLQHFRLAAYTLFVGVRLSCASAFHIGTATSHVSECVSDGYITQVSRVAGR